MSVFFSGRRSTFVVYLIKTDDDQTQNILLLSKVCQDQWIFHGQILFLVSHYGSFLPKLFHFRTPLNKLLKKGVPWNWSSVFQSTFKKIKSTLLLINYNPSLDIMVVSDISYNVVRAVISHIFSVVVTRLMLQDRWLPHRRTMVNLERKLWQLYFS